jgi:hypothetical protein
MAAWRETWQRNRAALACGAAATAITVGLTIASPPRRVESLTEFLLKLVPFFLATEAIARLDLDHRTRSIVARIGLVVTFLGFWAYFVPKIFFYAGVGEDFDQLYVTIFVLTPYVILGLVAACRLGGAAAGLVRRLSWSMLLLMVSGIEDLAFLTVNQHTDPRFTSVPDRWTWATHMRVRLGHYPTKYEAYVFIAVHVVAALVVLFAPVPTAWRRRLGRRWPSEVPPHEGQPADGDGSAAAGTDGDGAGAPEGEQLGARA